MIQSAKSIHNSKVLPVGLDLVWAAGLKLSASAYKSVKDWTLFSGSKQFRLLSHRIVKYSYEIASDVDYNRLYSDFIVGVSEWANEWMNEWMAQCSRRILSMQTEQECRLWERGEGEGAAHKQGLQRVLASINQLRKEREEFAYPPPVWEREREKRGGWNWIGSQESWHGWEREWEGEFPKKRKRSSFLNGLNRARTKEEETVGEDVASEDKEAWKVLLIWNKCYDGCRQRESIFWAIFLFCEVLAFRCFHQCPVTDRGRGSLWCLHMLCSCEKRWMQNSQTVVPLVLRFAWESTSCCLYLPTALCLLKPAACITQKKRIGECRAVHRRLTHLREFPCQTSQHHSVSPSLLFVQACVRLPWQSEWHLVKEKKCCKGHCD